MVSRRWSGRESLRNFLGLRLHRRVISALTMTEMLSRRSREAVRDQMSSTVLREIDDMWQDEGFAPPAEDPEPVGGQRVTRFQGYLNQVDWSDAGHVSRALRVFEVALRTLTHPHPDADPAYIQKELDRVRRLLAKDGYTFTEDGKITGGPVAVVTESLLVGPGLPKLSPGAR
jgi:hypothetical protein